MVLSIDCYDGDFPAMVVDSPMVHFLSEIDAEISFDNITYEEDEEEYLRVLSNELKNFKNDD